MTPRQPAPHRPLERSDGRTVLGRLSARSADLRPWPGWTMTPRRPAPHRPLERSACRTVMDRLPARSADLRPWPGWTMTPRQPAPLCTHKNPPFLCREGRICCIWPLFFPQDEDKDDRRHHRRRAEHDHQREDPAQAAASLFRRFRPAHHVFVELVRRLRAAFRGGRFRFRGLRRGRRLFRRLLRGRF